MSMRFFPADTNDDVLRRYSDVAPGDLVVSVTGRGSVVSLMSAHPDDAAYVESQTGTAVIERTGAFSMQTVGLVLAVRGRYCYVTSGGGTGWLWTEFIMRA